MASKKLTGSQKIKWGKDADCDLQITAIEKQGRGTTLHGVSKHEKVQIAIPFSDSASIENACHCWLYLLDEGMLNETIAERMLQLQPIAMRLEMKEAVNGCTLINDSYNSDLESLSIALDFLNRQHQHPKKILEIRIINRCLHSRVTYVLPRHQVHVLRILYSLLP